MTVLVSKGLILCWTQFLTCILKQKKSQQVIAGTLLVLPTPSTDYFYLTNYCPKENVNNFSLRRLFYSRQLFQKQTVVPLHRQTTRCCGNYQSQRLIVAQTVNLLKSDIQWEVHKLCIHKRTRQGTTTVFYQLFI